MVGTMTHVLSIVNRVHGSSVGKQGASTDGPFDVGGYFLPSPHNSLFVNLVPYLCCSSKTHNKTLTPTII